MVLPLVVFSLVDVIGHARPVPRVVVVVMNAVGNPTEVSRRTIGYGRSSELLSSGWRGSGKDW